MSSAVWSGEVRISDVDKENDSMLQFSPIVAKRKSIMSTTTNALTTSNASNAQSTLICAKFQDILVLDFGEVRFGQTHALHFNLKNPSSTRDINISVAKISTKNGLSIALGEENHAEEVHIASDSSVPGIVFWNPSQNHYKIREIIGLKMDGKSPLQITIHGVCGNPDLFVSFSAFVLFYLIFDDFFISIFVGWIRQQRKPKQIQFNSKES